MFTPSDRSELKAIFTRNGFTFDEDGVLTKPRDCNQFHQNLLLTVFINGGLNLVNGRYKLADYDLKSIFARSKRSIRVSAA